MTKLKDIMTKDVETCSLLDNVYEVALKMKEHNIGSIPIVDAEKLVGMMTDRDIVLRCIAEKHPASSKGRRYNEQTFNNSRTRHIS